MTFTDRFVAWLLDKCDPPPPPVPTERVVIVNAGGAHLTLPISREVAEAELDTWRRMRPADPALTAGIRVVPYVQGTQ